MRAAGRDISRSVAPTMTSVMPSQSARMGSTGDNLGALSVASRAGVSLKTRGKCGLGRLRLAADGPGPGERQRRRGGELGSRFVGTWTCRMKCQKVLFAAIAQNFGREGLHIMTASMRLVHEGCGSGHFTVGGAGVGLRKALAIASDGVHRRQSRALSVASRAGVSLQTRA